MTERPATHAAHDMPTDPCATYGCRGLLVLEAAADVSDEVVTHVVDMADADYGDSPIDWETLLDNRLDGMQMEDGRTLLLGEQYDSPAIRKIQREVRKARRA